MARNPWGATYKTWGTYSTSTCSDDMTVFDAYGDSCSWYTNNPTGCGGYDDDDFTSTVACCACGGGTATTPFWE